MVSATIAEIKDENSYMYAFSLFSPDLFTTVTSRSRLFQIIIQVNELSVRILLMSFVCYHQETVLGSTTSVFLADISALIAREVEGRQRI